MTKASTYDADAQLFFNAQTAAGVTLTTTEKDAVNQWVIDAKAAGIWTKKKAIYPIVGGTATAHKFNLKNPLDTNAAFRLVFSGGWTHSATGMLPNGTNAYANTFCGTNNMLLNSAHISYYSRTNTTSNTGYEMASYNSAVPSTSELVIKQGASGGIVRINSVGSAAYTLNPNSSGLFLSNRTASNITKFIRNGISLNTYANASTGVSSQPFYLGGANNNGSPFGYSILQCAFASIGDGLTDLESQLFYQITEKYQVALGRNINALQSFYYNSAYNNETNAFLFSTQITNTTIQTATNTLVTDLKTAGVFTKMKALYPMVGGTATTCKFNLVNPQDTNAAFRLNFVGGWTPSATGMTPNGINAYADTFLNSLSNLTGTSTHLSYYSRTATTALAVEIGCGQVVPPYCGLELAPARVFHSGEEGGASSANFTTTTNAQGFWLGTKRSNTDRENYLNGVSQTTKTVSDTLAFPNLTLYLGAINRGTPNLYSAKQCAFASIGDGLTDAEVLALYNAVQNFNTTLARQV